MNSTSSQKVLIVDDNDLMRTLLRTILRGDQYEVIGEARDGVEALELAERLRPDIICLDILMPKIGSLEALQTIRSMHPEIVVVMVTGSPSVDNVREAIQGGASGFVVEPFNAGKVLDTVSRAWQSARRLSTLDESL